MVDGGWWEWRSDGAEGRWVAHAPVEQGATKVQLIAVGLQTFMWVLASSDSLVRRHPWVILPWLAVFLPWTIALVIRLRSREVTFDGEHVEIPGRGWPSRTTRFRLADVTAARSSSPMAAHLLTFRVRHRLRSVVTEVPTWWWVQMGLDPGLITAGRGARAWARLRGRPVPA